MRVLLGITAIALLAGVQCPPQNGNGGENQPPDAQAGADQTVALNAVVTLNGSGSSDPEGGALTFQWEQTAGSPTVTLTNANTSIATFTAPNQNTTLTFRLTVTDDAGATDTAFTNVTVGSGAVVTPQLFIANFNGNSVTSYTNPATINGNIAPTTNLQGAQTQLILPADIVVTLANTLIASNFGANSLTSYLNASTANGNIEPTGNVVGAATGLIGPLSLAVNATQDLVFVANNTANNITVYNNASTAAFNGNLSPIRTINSADLAGPIGINFGANDELYVANSGTNRVAVFANASNLNGTVTATRVITSTAINTIFDVFVDNSDNLFVVDALDDQILVFRNAATLNGAQAPDITLQVQGGGTLTAVAVDAGGRGYIIDNPLNAVYSYDNIANRNGVLLPDRTIAGANTQLNGPIRVFLVE